MPLIGCDPIDNLDQNHASEDDEAMGATSPPPPSYENAVGNQDNASNYPAQRYNNSQGLESGLNNAPPTPPPRSDIQSNQPVPVVGDIIVHQRLAMERNQKQNLAKTLLSVVCILVVTVILLSTMYPCTFNPPECTNGTVCINHRHSCRSTIDGDETCHTTAVCSP